MSYLLLHNGNRLVKPWAAKFYDYKEMPCLTASWNKINNLNLKYSLASTTSICTDLTTADHFDVKELFNAKNSFEVIKVITCYKSDLENLEPVWNNGYNETQWIESIFFRLSSADRVIFYQPVTLTCLHSGPAIVFTPGRSGTHILQSVTGIPKFLHHNNNLLMKDKFTNLVNSEKIFSVLRKRFVDQVISDAIGETYGIMLTTVDNLDTNQAIVSGWNSLTLSTVNYQRTLEKLFNYADLLLGLKIFYNKQINFSVYEELKEHFNKIPYIKNPYRSEDIISNYSECVAICEQEYQPMYDQLISKLQYVFGTNLYNYDQSI